MYLVNGKVVDLDDLCLSTNIGKVVNSNSEIITLIPKKQKDFTFTISEFYISISIESGLRVPI